MSRTINQHETETRSIRLIRRAEMNRLTVVNQRVARGDFAEEDGKLSVTGHFGEAKRIAFHS